MTRLLSKVGDSLLAMVVPRAEASADPTYLECRCKECFLQQRTCGPGGCTAWQTIGRCYAGGCDHGPWGC